MENPPVPVEHGLISRFKRKIVDVVAPESAQPTAMVSYSKSKPPADNPKSVAVPLNLSAIVSSVKRIEEPNERINIGSNLSQVQRALQSGTFKPLPPARDAEYQKIVDKSIKDANFKTETKSKGFKPRGKPLREMSLAERESLYESSGAGGYHSGDSPLSFDEWWEYTEGRGATKNPRLLSREERDRILNSHEEETPDRTGKKPPFQNHKKIGRPTKHWGDDTLNKIDKVVDAAAEVVTHPVKKIGFGARKKTDQAYADWQEKGKRGKLAKQAYDDTFAKRKVEVNKEKQNQAIEDAKKDAIYHAETTFTERRVDDAKDVINAGKKAIPVVKTVAKAGFHGAKTGIRAFNELSDEIVKNPMLIKMGENNEATLREMGAHAALARGSIRATGLGNKRNMTAGSLIKQHSFGTTNNTATFAGAGATNQYGITSRYEKGIGGRAELHYYAGNTRITHQQVARVLTTKQIHELKKVAKYNILGQQPVQYQAQAQAQKTQAPFAQQQTAPVLNVTNTHSGLMKKRVESVSGLAKKRIQGNPIGQGIRASAPFSAPVKRIVL